MAPWMVGKSPPSPTTIRRCAIPAGAPASPRKTPSSPTSLSSGVTVFSRSHPSRSKQYMAPSIVYQPSFKQSVPVSSAAYHQRSPLLFHPAERPEEGDPSFCISAMAGYARHRLKTAAARAILHPFRKNLFLSFVPLSVMLPVTYPFCLSYSRALPRFHFSAPRGNASAPFL